MNRHVFSRLALFSCISSALLATGAWADGIGIVSRARLGHNKEAATFVDSGPLAGSMVIVDGHDLFAVRIDSDREEGGKVGPKRLADLRDLAIGSAIRGIAWISAEQVFVAWEPTHTSTLFLLDAKGRPLSETRSVKYLDGFVPAHVEGLAYVPSMDRIVGSVFDASFVGHLVVMRRDGQVESEIFPQPPLDEEFISGVGFRPGNATRPDELLLGTAGFALSTLFTMDFDGNVRDAVDLSPDQDFEGIGQLPSGDVVAVPYNPGSLRFLDPDLNPTPARDLSYTIGIGKNLPFTLAWDPDLDRLLVDRQGIPVVTEVAAVTVPSLRAASTVVDLDPFVDVGQFVAVTYLPAQHTIGSLHNALPRALFEFDNGGNPIATVTFPASIPCNAGAPVLRPPCAARGSFGRGSFIPPLDQFALRLIRGINPGEGHMLRFVSRDGILVRSADVSLAPIGIQGFSNVGFAQPRSGPPQLVFVDTVALQLVFTDLGLTTVFDRVAFRELGLTNIIGVAGITSGPQAGTVAVSDQEDSEIVIFRPRRAGGGRD